MKVESYNNEIIDSVAQVMDVFNDIVISRTKSDGTLVKKFRVPIVYGQRDRALKDLENRNRTVKLPINTLVVTGISRDSSRVIDRNQIMKLQDGSGIFNPHNAIGVPVNIQFTMDSIATSTEDLLRIYSNWSIWFNPDVFVVIPNPKGGDKVKCQLTWNGDFNIDWDNNDANKAQRFSATSTFTYKGWMWPGSGADTYVNKRIKVINYPCDIDDDGRLINSWHSVPNNIGFDLYRDNWENRLIKDYLTWDSLTISGGISGYWRDVSGEFDGIPALSGEVDPDDFILITDDGSLLMTNNPDTVDTVIENWNEFYVDAD